MLKKIILLAVLSVVSVGIGQSRIYGQDADDNLPIPKFDSPRQQVFASQLRVAMLNMRRHLCAKTNQPSDQWEHRFEGLLNELVVAQHRTVWAAAGDFDGGLVEYEGTLKPYHDSKDKILGLLKEAAKNKPANAAEINAIVEKLNENSRKFVEAANAHRVGYVALVTIGHRAILSELDLDLPAAKLEQFGIPEATYASFRNGAMPALGQTLGRIYSRAISNINGRLPANSPRFSIYYSNDYQQSTAIARAFSETVSIPFDVEKFESLEYSLWNSYARTEFNETVQRNLRGACGKETVLINHAPSRRADAEKAKQILSENNFKADLRQVAEDADKKGKIYYQSNGNRDGANAIAGFLRTIESVNPDQGASDPNTPAYSLWIIGKKQIQARGKGVRIIYSDTRLNDANKAAELLRENGFTVTELLHRTAALDVKMVYYNLSLGVNGSENEANEIAAIIKDIETVASTPLAVDNRAPQYVLWIVTGRGR